LSEPPSDSVNLSESISTLLLPVGPGSPRAVRRVRNPLQVLPGRNGFARTRIGPAFSSRQPAAFQVVSSCAMKPPPPCFSLDGNRLVGTWVGFLWAPLPCKLGNAYVYRIYRVWTFNSEFFLHLIHFIGIFCIFVTKLTYYAYCMPIVT
jgi:hypothetical protein